MQISNVRSAGGNVPGGPNLYPKLFYLREYVVCSSLCLMAYWSLCFFTDGCYNSFCFYMFSHIGVISYANATN